VKTSLKLYVTAVVLATTSLAYAQTQDTTTTPAATTPSTTPAETTPSSTPAETTPSSPPAATTPSTTPAGTTPSTTDTTEDGDDDNMADDTSLAPRSDRN